MCLSLGELLDLIKAVDTCCLVFSCQCSPQCFSWQASPPYNHYISFEGLLFTIFCKANSMEKTVGFKDISHKSAHFKLALFGEKNVFQTQVFK